MTKAEEKKKNFIFWYELWQKQQKVCESMGPFKFPPGLCGKNEDGQEFKKKAHQRRKTESLFKIKWKVQIRKKVFSIKISFFFWYFQQFLKTGEFCH